MHPGFTIPKSQDTLQKLGEGITLFPLTQLATDMSARADTQKQIPLGKKTPDLPHHHSLMPVADITSVKRNLMD